MFGAMHGVLGIGNVKVTGGYQTVFFDKEGINNMSPDAPNFAYSKIPLFLGNVINMFRISMGDFAVIDLVKYLHVIEEVIVFWILWFLMVLALAVVFLNFVVAEASETYNKVNESIVEFIYQQKADLIADAESIMPNKLKYMNHFPQYIIKRKVET